MAGSVVNGRKHADVPDKGVDLDLSINATGIEIDDVLAKALPSVAERRLYERFSPTGVATHHRHTANEGTRRGHDLRP